VKWERCEERERKRSTAPNQFAREKEDRGKNADVPIVRFYIRVSIV